jgi:hypothetical protein
MNRHLRDRQFLGFTRGLQGRRPDDNIAVLIDAIDAVAESVSCADMNDGVCHLDQKNQCRCRDAAEKVMVIAWDAEREAQLQP